MATVSFEDVGKRYPDGTQALADFSLDIEDGEFMVFVGPSGCGKTTALRIVSGLEELSAGVVRIDGAAVNTVEPRRRDVAMVFQNYALYPHMSVFDNIAFPLRARGASRNEIHRRVTDTATMLGIDDQLKRRPRNLSGGQRQRVAMGRAIVREPKVFLMDEPLSNLDAKLRMQMRGEIARLQRKLGVTTLYVTHDQVEALTMGDRIAVLRKGVLQQQGRPQELFDEPINLFVATFMGSPAMNLVRTRLVRDGDGLACLVGAQRIRLPESLFGRNGRVSAYVDRDVVLGIRPEHVRMAEGGGGDAERLIGTVVLIESLGSEHLVHLEIDGAPVTTADVLEIAEDIDAAALQTLQEEASKKKVPFIARVETASRNLREVEGRNLWEVEACFNIMREKIRLFDVDSGDIIH